MFFTADSAPAAHPHHERRKFLYHAPGTGERRIARFAGLGRAGRARLLRAQVLAGAGWGQPPAGLSEGFLVLPFVEGRPVEDGLATRPLMDAIVRYLTRVRRAFPAPRTTSVDAMLHMIDVNAAEAGIAPGRDAMRAVAVGAQESAMVDAVALDGRMLRHEWLATGDTFAKVDSLDHHDDHFFPGTGDPAWDLAAALFELDWSRSSAAALKTAYARAANDQTLDVRLPFLAAAFLAFRLGYCMLAASTLHDTADGDRFATLAVRYRAALAARLGARGATTIVDRRATRTVT